MDTSLLNKVKEFFSNPIGIQIYSFIKTYITVFLGIYLSLQAVMANPDLAALQEVNLININILALSAKGACISILRNVYKMLTEK